MKQHFDSIIIGAGIAGMTAAIYLKRANKNILIVEKYIPGGQINKTSSVENYPGYMTIDGPSLVMNMVDQVNHLEIPIIYEEVEKIEKTEVFFIKTNKNEYTASTIILATGRTPNQLGLTEEDRFVGRGISYCALCDGNFFREKEVVVIGGGNSAFEESLYLSNICKKVTILNRSNHLRADEILIQKVQKTSNIEIIYECTIQNIEDVDGKITSVVTNKGRIPCEGIFIYIGLTPETAYLQNLPIEQEKNYVIVDSQMRTNIKGLYACGDVIQKRVYQIVTSAGEGAIAALSVIKDME